ncbi:MAG: Gp138 family membrane-puncturing spike protein [Acetobacteraceae bacterium]|nr:Gp138 family membrane-puncturing spike protein [Acetobacteraceae bacterium]
MDFRERWEDPEEAFRAGFGGLQSKLWTALPGIVESFDAAAMTVTVQPAIQATAQRDDGSTVNMNRPLLPDLPVVFPGGGGVTLTFPVRKGDECLVVFASRAIDGWWQSGGTQLAGRPRMHSLSDGFALVGVRSKARALSGVSTSTTQLRSDDGATVVELDPAGGVVRIVAPGGLTLDTPEVTCTGKVTAAQDVKAGTVSLQHHVHTAVQPGGGLSGQPQV